MASIEVVLDAPRGLMTPISNLSGEKKHRPLKSAHISTKVDVYIALEINLNLNYYSTVDLDISISAECVFYKMPASNPWKSMSCADFTC